MLRVRAGDAEPALSWGSCCCQVVVPVFSRLCCPLLGAEHHPRIVLVGGPGSVLSRRWVMCELCAGSDGTDRL